MHTIMLSYDIFVGLASGKPVRGEALGFFAVGTVRRKKKPNLT